MKYLIEVRRAKRPEDMNMTALMSRADYTAIATGLAAVEHPSLKIVHVVHEEVKGKVKVMVESPLPLGDVQRALESILGNDALTAAADDVAPVVAAG
jgi:hypothetical protein